jgi:hypothetical protein
VVACLAIGELTELRGELAFARFLRFCQLAKVSGAPYLAEAVNKACTEADLVMTFSTGNADALREVARTFLQWSGKKELSPDLRLRLADMSAQAAALAVRAAPADYENWLWFARTQRALGLQKQAQLCLERAQELAPPGAKMGLSDT